MSGQYLTILQESLRKKIQILDEVQRICDYQSELLNADSIDYEKFDQYVDDKDICIEQLNQLDEGFEQLYNRVREELQNNKAQHAEWINTAKELIAQITEKSVAIQAKELRNKQTLETVFNKERANLGKGKKSVKAAMDYYRNMSKTNVITSQYMDKKK